MTTYALPQKPNMSFSIETGGTVFDFHVRMFRDILYCTVSDTTGTIVESQRCVNNGWIIPNGFKTKGVNFRFEDTNGLYPDYRNLGTSCTFVSYEDGEIEE